MNSLPVSQQVQGKQTFFTALINWFSVSSILLDNNPVMCFYKNARNISMGNATKMHQELREI